MTYTSDQQLAALGLRRLEDLPRRPGARVMLHALGGDEIPASVVYDPSSHPGESEYLALLFNGVEPSAFHFVGWKPA